MVVPDIFYVEDDPDFGFIMSQLINKVDSLLTLQVITNGKEALDVLMATIKQPKKPQLILLDFNLPGLTGLELLIKIRAMPFFDAIPVLIFSTADNPKDIKKCIDAGANEYVFKIAGYLNLLTTIKAIFKRWIGAAVSINKTATKKLLIIEDDRDFADIIELSLKKTYHVKIKNDSNDLIAALEQFKPDMLLIDNHIGQRTAKEIITEIRLDNSFTRIPVILYSAHSNVELMAKELNASAWLLKPFKLIDLFITIEKVLLNEGSAITVYDKI